MKIEETNHDKIDMLKVLRGYNASRSDIITFLMMNDESFELVLSFIIRATHNKEKLADICAKINTNRGVIDALFRATNDKRRTSILNDDEVALAISFFLNMQNDPTRTHEICKQDISKFQNELN